MKASEVIAELNRLIAEHGDLEILYECKEGLLEIEMLELSEVQFLKAKPRADVVPTPVFIIS